MHQKLLQAISPGGCKRATPNLVEEMDMIDEIEVEESEAVFDINLFKDKTTLILFGDKNTQVDEKELRDKFKRQSGLGNIRNLQIDPSSTVRNCIFLEPFENLDSLFVRGRNIDSLDGIEYLSRLSFIEVDTGCNKRRNIRKLDRSNISTLNLTCAKTKDLDCVDKAHNIRDLRVNKCHNFSTETIKNSKIKKLSLLNSNFTEIGNFNLLKKLSYLKFHHCRRLKSFMQKSGNVANLLLDTCKGLEFDSLVVFFNLRVLRISSCGNFFRLSIIKQMPLLSELSIERCKITMDCEDIVQYCKYLKKVWLYGIENEDMSLLSQANPGIVFSNGKKCYRDGNELSVDFYFK
jgi:hypothetical protein